MKTPTTHSPDQGCVEQLEAKLQASAQQHGMSLVQALDVVEGMVSEEEAKLLYAVAEGCTQGCIVEVGSYRGRSTVALAMGARDGSQPKVYAIDPHEPFEGILGGQFGPEDRRAFFEAMLKTGAYSNVRLINLSSEVVAPGWKEPIGVLWIDGDHRYEGVRRDFEAWAWSLTRDAIVMFDDATNTSLGPYRLIQELIATGMWKHVGSVGKVVAIARTS